METVSGTGNWKLNIRRTDSGIAILRASTCDVSAVLPEEIFGLPVTELGSRALKPEASHSDGEEVLIVCGRAEGEFDNRRIQELTLPRYLRSIGEYAFMNCSAMHTLALHDEVENMSSTALMNCRALRHIKLSRGSREQGSALHSIVSGLARELDVEISTLDGETARLIFPEYYELFTEIGPSHFFNYNIEGAGFPYHHVFKARRLDLKDYDALWDNYLSAEHGADIAVKLAWWRVRYPAELTESARNAYLKYLGRHLRELLDLVLQSRDIPGLNLLLKKLSFSPEELAYARDLAGELRFTEAMAILLEHQHRSAHGSRNRSFEL